MSLAIKRFIDFSASLAGIILLWPLMAVVALLIRLRMGSPVLFRQMRPGLHRKPFVLLKFSTMTEERDKEGNLLPDADRLTKLGCVLRRFSLDELPQLFNVLKGEMSLVGPRPLLMKYLDLYSSEQTRRHNAKPGITGWAQVNGRNALDWDTRLAMDCWYVDNRSLRLDIRILFMTVAKALRGEGISQEGQATVEEFKGPSREGNFR